MREWDVDDDLLDEISGIYEEMAAVDSLEERAAILRSRKGNRIACLMGSITLSLELLVLAAEEEGQLFGVLDLLEASFQVSLQRLREDGSRPAAH